MAQSSYTLMVGTDHSVPVEPLGGTASVAVGASGSTVYYADNPQVSAAHNQGSIAAGAAQSFTNLTYLISAGVSSVTVTLTDSSPAKPGQALVSSGTGTTWGVVPANAKAVQSPRMQAQASYAAISAPTFTDDAGTPTIANGALTAASTAGVIPAVPFRYQWADVTASGPPSGYVGELSQSIATRAYGLLQPFCVEFDFDGQAFEALLQSPFSNIGTWRVWANEQVSATQTMANTSAHYIKIDFGSRAYRRVMLELDTQMIFGGVYAAITDSVRLPSTKGTGKFAVVGDSYSAGEGINNNVNNYNARSYAHTLARALGFVDRRMYGIPGTGIVKAVGTSAPNYQTRITDVQGYNPDFLLVQGSINDNGQSGVQSATTAYLQALQSALPYTVIVMCGPLSVSTAATSLNSSYQAAASTCGVPFVDTVTPNWFTGTGNAGTPNSTGNNDFYQSQFIAGHPSQAGHDYLGYQLAREIAPLFGLGL